MLCALITHHRTDLIYLDRGVLKQSDSMFYPNSSKIFHEITACMLFKETAQIGRVHANLAGYRFQSYFACKIQFNIILQWRYHIDIIAFFLFFLCIILFLIKRFF